MKITKVKQSKIHSFNFQNAIFGHHFTDHMLICNYKNKTWYSPEIIPYGPINITPSIMALHYGQIVFEGMKAYKDNNDNVFLFRPEKNFQRFNQSCTRLAIPTIPKEIFIDGIKTLVDLERNWISKKIGTSLYIRPFIFASQALLSAKISEEYKFIILCTYANDYYNKPLKVKIADYFSRSTQGGVGFAKTAGNYGGAFYPTQIANQEGFDQIIWTDSYTHTYIEECGTMNVIFRIKDTLFTPPISDTILNGITRDSLIQLAKYNHIKIIEKKISVHEIYEAYKNSNLKEAFGCGTAVIINEFQIIGYKNKILKFNSLNNNSFASKLKQEIMKIQYNLSEDIFNWRLFVKKQL